MMPAAGQSARTNDPFEIRSEADYLPFERLSRYTRATFAAQLNSTFRLKREVGFVLMTLEEVRDAGYPTVTPVSGAPVALFVTRPVTSPGGDSATFSVVVWPPVTTAWRTSLAYPLAAIVTCASPAATPVSV